MNKGFYARPGRGRVRSATSPGKRRLASALLSLALAGVASFASAQDTHLPAQADPAADLQGYVAGASQLEGQIRAPCCWNQTIDIHGSEVSQSLRREIRKRLRGGETVDAIRADIVARYGERVLAVPAGNPLKDVAVLLVLGVVLAGAFAFVFVSRWRRRSAKDSAATAGSPKPERDRWDERLDTELEKLD